MLSAAENINTICSSYNLSPPYTKLGLKIQGRKIPIRLQALKDNFNSSKSHRQECKFFE